MKNVLYAGVSLVALLGAGAASAADMPGRIRSEPVPVLFSWSGFYVGTHTGVAVGKTTTKNTAPYGGFDAGVPLSYQANPVNIFGGGQIGYNWQAGAYVFGLEGDFGYLGLSSTVSPLPDNYMSVKYGWYGTMTGRLGFSTDRLLTYVKGGAAVASITNTAGDYDGFTLDPSNTVETKKTRWGWTVGTGFEYALTPTWSVKSEYMYMNFGKSRATSADGSVYEHQNNVQSLKVGLNYRWGGAQPVVARY